MTSPRQVEILLTRTELARSVGVSEATVRRAVHAGELVPDVALRPGPGMRLIEGFRPARITEIRASLK